MEHFEKLRLIEAILFASAEPVAKAQMLRILPEDAEIEGLLEELRGLYANRGINLVQVGDRWAFRTAADLTAQLKIEKKVERKLSRAAIETLAIIAYHQPVTRGEIEEVRGVSLSRGTLDVLLESGWIKPKGRRRTPGRPVTWGTNEPFLDHFGLETLDALPGLADLKAAGLLDKRPAATVLKGSGMRLEEWSQTHGENEEDELDPMDQSEPWELLAAEFQSGADAGDDSSEDDSDAAEPSPEQLEDEDDIEDSAETEPAKQETAAADDHAPEDGAEDETLVAVAFDGADERGA